MRDPCKLMIAQEGRFVQPQNQADLLSNKTTQQDHETCPHRRPPKKKWWHETHILPSKLSKSMTPGSNLSAHLKNNILTTCTLA